MGGLYTGTYRSILASLKNSWENDRTRLLFIIDGVFINAAAVLTAGIFLSGYIILLGGSDFLVGVVKNSAIWASIVAFFSFLIYERLEKRKKLLLCLHGISRFLLGSVVFFPLFINNNKINLILVSSCVIIGNITWAIYSVGFSVWLMNSVPKESRSNFVYQRMFWLRISFTIVTLVMGKVLDLFNKSYEGFLFVFISSLIFSLGDLIALANIKEAPNIVKKETKINSEIFLEPLKSHIYRGFLIFVFLFYCFLNISGSFSTVYFIRYLDLDYSILSAFDVSVYVFMIISIRYWRKIESKHDVKFVLKISSYILIFEFAVYAFLRKESAMLIFLGAILSGIGNGGFNIAIFTYRYDIMPEDNRTLYEAWFGAVYGISTLVAPVIGNFFIKTLPEISIFSLKFNSFQINYFISFAISLSIIFFSFSGPGKLRVMKDIRRGAYEI
ncbi:MAG TPA: MFS transporter [Clostridiaceae bacterium]|nr:MFS transporter [Clostridiaceae bacterium]